MASLHEPSQGCPPKAQQGTSTVPISAHPKPSSQRLLSCLAVIFSQQNARQTQGFTAKKREPLQGPVGRADGSWHSAQAEKLQLQTLFCSDLYQDLAFPFFLPNGKKKKAFQVRGKKSIYSWVK